VLTGKYNSANLPGKQWPLGIRDGSNNQKALLIKAGLCPHMLDPLTPIGSEEIKSQAVFGFPDFIDQLLSHNGPLGRVNDAFENRVLHALAVVFTYLGHSPQPALSAFIGSRHIIADKHHHKFYLQTKGG
jgi:hypothetical protein